MPVNVCFTGRGLLEIKAGMLITRGGKSGMLICCRLKQIQLVRLLFRSGDGGIIVIAFRPLSRFPPLS